MTKRIQGTLPQKHKQNLRRVVLGMQPGDIITVYPCCEEKGPLP